MKLRLLGALACAWVALVAMSAAGEVQIEKVLPFATDHDVRVQVVTNARGAGAQLAATITPVDGGQPLWSGSLGQVDSTGTLEKTIADLKPRLWRPGYPSLYQLTVSSHGATKSIRFGFRSVEAHDGHIYLNGHPIFLKGIAINPPERDIPEETGYDPKFVHDYVKFLRSQNVNIIRMTFMLKPDPRQQIWYDACDELGMMIYQGNYGTPPSTSKSKAATVDPDEQPEVFAGKAPAATGRPPRAAPPTDFEGSIALYKETFEAYVRHPSIIIYILSNEQPGPNGTNSIWHPFLSKVYDRIHAWDPTRLIIGNAGYGLGREGDINDVHRYWGWYYNSFLTYYGLRDSVGLFGQSTDKQPLTFSECVGSFTSPIGTFNLIFRKQLAPQLGWTGHSPDQVKDSLEYQAFLVQHAIESFRTMREQNPRLSGLMPFTIQFFNWAGVTSFDQMKPKPSMLQMGVSYSPVLLSWEMWQPNVYGGATIRATAHVVNDSEDFSDLTGAKLNVEIAPVKRHGAVVYHKTIDLPDVPYYSAKPISIDIQIPKVPSDDYLLSGAIVAGGKIISQNHIGIYIEEKRPTIAAGSERIAVYDPSGATMKAMKTFGESFEAISDLSSPPTAKYLVIGEMAFDKPAALPAIRAYIDNGGHVLCLAQEREKFDTSWLPAQVELLRPGAAETTYPPPIRPTADQSHVNPERPWHMVLAGVPREHLRLWSDYTWWDQSQKGTPKVFPVTHGFRLTKVDDLSKIAIIADYEHGLDGIAIAEMFSGKGSVMFTGLDLVSRSGADPVADRVLANMLRYLVALDHETQPLIDKPIEWGEYATERGVLTGAIQGLVYNCRWIKPPTATPDMKPEPDNTGAWNTHPGNLFIAQGIRAIGPFIWNNGASSREQSTSETGTGQFCCRVPSGRAVVVSKVENTQKTQMEMKVSVNGDVGTTTSVSPGQTVTIRTPIPSSATDLTIQYTGGKQLVILETSFE
jgi:beta-galactosidase